MAEFLSAFVLGNAGLTGLEHQGAGLRPDAATPWPCSAVTITEHLPSAHGTTFSFGNMLTLALAEGWTGP